MKHYVSPNLRRHGDSQEVVQWMFLAIATAFWAATWFKVGPVMRPETIPDALAELPAAPWAI